MVKVKEGYVMTAREKTEFDRVNALPRKVTGRVDYYYKPQTKYPPRIYVYMHAETWCDRNRRPMGLFYAHPFLSRPMNAAEIEYHHFDIRLCYHQYEDWDKLLYAEEQEAGELDKEKPGTGTSFFEKLKSFREQYTIGKPANRQPSVKDDEPESEESLMIRELIHNGHHYPVKEIGKMLENEQNDKKRLSILILLRQLYKNVASEIPEKLTLTPEILERKIFHSQERTRKNFVRRVFKKNKLFALQEIQTRYPHYSETMLVHDLFKKTARIKGKKCKLVLDLRRCQLEKLAGKLKVLKTDTKDYHETCCRIALLQQAHKSRLPIPLTVRLNNETLVYYFNWKTRESVVKSFVILAKSKGMSHSELGQKYQEMTASSYSY